MTVRLVSPRQLAYAIGASESSLKRWSDAGKIEVTRTEGGHRRIAIAEAVRFIRATRSPVLHPDALGLPAVDGDGDQVFHDLLVKGERQAVVANVTSRFLAGATVPALCDGPLRAALTRIGELWRDSMEGVMVEHRATSVCIEALVALRAVLAVTTAGASAVGGAPPGDPYQVPSMMCATALHEAGLRAINLGPESPLDVIGRAARDEGARLVWLSTTSPIDPATQAVFAHFCDDMAQLGATVIVGGRHADDLPVPLSARRAGTIGELVAIAEELRLVRRG